MYRVAIVEDENEAVEAIEKCLVRYSSDEGINFDVMVYDTGLKFLDAYSPAFDIVFMDIEMPDIDGIKTAEKLRQMDSCVGLVFITNLARYAIKGYEYDALDYILKPLIGWLRLHCVLQIVFLFLSWYWCRFGYVLSVTVGKRFFVLRRDIAWSI